MSSEFIEWAKKNNKIKPAEEAFKEFPPEEEEHKGDISSYIVEKNEHYIAEESSKYGNYNIGDIVFVYNFEYPNKTKGNNHMFVIIDENKQIVPFEYFGLLISSNLEKLKYKQNVPLKKNYQNKLHKDSLVKTDYIYLLTENMISYKMGSVPLEQINYFKDCVRKNAIELKNEDEYIKENKNLIEVEYSLLEELSKIRHTKNLSQRKLAEIIGIKQPMLANIEKKKNSPQLNTLLMILDSLGYTITFEEK